MTATHADLLALVDLLRDRIAFLERQVAELTAAKPRPTCESLYPRRPDEA